MFVCAHMCTQELLFIMRGFPPEYKFKWDLAKRVPVVPKNPNTLAARSL